MCFTAASPTIPAGNSLSTNPMQRPLERERERESKRVSIDTSSRWHRIPSSSKSSLLDGDVFFILHSLLIHSLIQNEMPAAQQSTSAYLSSRLTRKPNTTPVRLSLLPRRSLNRRRSVSYPFVGNCVSRRSSHPFSIAGGSLSLLLLSSSSSFFLSKRFFRFQFQFLSFRPSFGAKLLNK